ncbi:MAG: RDD family protein [Myxococcales bacterium]|nr:RDD family protein [Myxococcales bacterium]MDD9967119.1 RDD family protein [Myxococcales bacterium]
MPADRGLRLLAHIVDVVALCVPLGTAVVAGLRAEATGQATAIFVAGGAAALVTTVVSLVGIQRTGQSLGKRVFGLQVLQSDGSRATLAQVVWRRNVLPLLLGLVPVLGWLFWVADPLFIFGRFGQCLHDRLADTIVVQRRT